MQNASTRPIRPARPTRAWFSLTVGAVGLSLLLAPAARASTPTTAAPKTGPPRHVFVINLENKSFDETWGSSTAAPYLATTLRRQGQFLPNYYAIGHVSLPNYVAQISGQGPSLATQSDCVTYTNFTSTGTGPLGQELGDGCVYPPSVPTIADQLTKKGLTWKSYQEDMANSATEPKTCRHPTIGNADSTLVARPGDQYATRHNPFVYFHSIIDTPACNANVVDLAAFPTDLASTRTTPNLSFITPNLCHDAHDQPCVDGQPGGLVSANQWLRTWVPRILNAPAYRQDGLLVITFDEAEPGGLNGDSSACCQEAKAPNVAQAGGNGPGGGRVGAVVLSPFVKPGTTNTTPYNHYALLCSLENSFGLAHLGYAAQPGLKCFGSDVYQRKH
jgi:phospholipase C